MPYTAEISRANPSCFLFLIDQSGSMADAWGGGQDGIAGSKALEVATIVNNLLRNIVLKCSKDEGVRNYFDVGVIGYGSHVGPAFGGTLAGRDLVAVADLADAPLRIEDRTRKVMDGAGGVLDTTVKFPVWFDPVSFGGTPMRAAFAEALRVLRPWIESHPASYPPIVFHITDGESTDGDPSQDAADLRRLGTQDGPVMLFNIHVSSQPEQEISFPAMPPGLPDAYATMLFDMSSDLPSEMRERLQMEGYAAPAGARGFIFNAEPTALVNFLDIGTRPANLR